jgi:DNA-binding transcriptional regulator GbsR (MarR family)
MDKAQKRAAFVEKYGMFAEKVGFPPMAGRIFAWVLTSVSPIQTAEQISMGLNTSRSSVSTATRLLIQWGLIERARMPGHRTNYYRISLDGCKGVVQAMIQLISEERKIVEYGLDLVKNSRRDLRQQLKTYRDLCFFCEHEFPKLIEKWEKEMKGK